jgi:hypothetical protein
MKALRSLLDRPELAERERDFLLVSDRAMLALLGYTILAKSAH